MFATFIADIIVLIVILTPIILIFRKGGQLINALINWLNRH